MRLPTKQETTLAVIALAVGGLVGYNFVPKRVEIREKIVEKKVSDTERTRDRDVVRVKEKRPDGTEVIRTEIKDRTREKTHTDQSSEKSSEKIAIRGSGSSVRIMVKGPLGDLSYGAGFEKQLIGPFSLGVFGFLDKTYGLSLGMEL